MFGIDRRTLVLVLATLLTFPLVAPAPARASERYVPITSVPYTINTPGGYRLAQNIAHDVYYGGAITINCDNVVLDFDGYTMENTLGTGGSAPGVYANNRSNVIVKNGTLRGFRPGIYLSAPSSNVPGIVVENMVLIASRSTGIWLDGTQGAVVRNCTVVSTSEPGQDTTGIFVSGPGAWVHDNEVHKTLQGAFYGVTAYGIHVVGSNALVERNKISNEPPFLPNCVGICADGENVIVAENRISLMGTGILYPTNATGKYRENVTAGCQTPFSGGTSAGNNY